ncbi:MAG: holo-ACP synthase [Bacteroidota bacterium]|nr:holo-ACP synthase [Bacteroidota bacterium]
MIVIHGIGVDIIEIERIQQSIDDYGHQFLKKLFTENEIQYCNAKQFPTQHFAARFAAKEALSKAISTGWSGEFEWKNVEIVNSPAGKPDFVFYGHTAKVLKDQTVFLSMSHSDSTVIAFVIIETK